MSYNPAMNIVFILIGSSSVDLWGANRTALDHKYGASVLALDPLPAKRSGFIRPCITILGTSTC